MLYLLHIIYKQIEKLNVCTILFRRYCTILLVQLMGTGTYLYLLLNLQSTQYIWQAEDIVQLLFYMAMRQFSIWACFFILGGCYCCCCSWSYLSYIWGCSLGLFFHGLFSCLNGWNYQLVLSRCCHYCRWMCLVVSWAFEDPSTIKWQACWSLFWTIPCLLCYWPCFLLILVTRCLSHS